VKKERLLSWLALLSAKYIALFALLVAVPVAGTAAYLLTSSYGDNKNALIRIQKDRAESISRSIEQFFEARIQTLESVVGTGATKIELEAQLNLLQDPTTVATGFIDRRGGRDVHQPLFTVARRTGRYFGPLVQAPGSGAFGGGSGSTMDISAAESAGPGVTAETVESGAFTDLLQGTRLGASGYAYVVDGRGRPVTHPNNAESPGRVQLTGTRTRSAGWRAWWLALRTATSGGAV